MNIKYLGRYFDPYFSYFSHSFSVNSQHTLVWYKYLVLIQTCSINILLKKIFGVKILSYVNILHAFSKLGAIDCI